MGGVEEVHSSFNACCHRNDCRRAFKQLEESMDATYRAVAVAEHLEKKLAEANLAARKQMKKDILEVLKTCVVRDPTMQKLVTQIETMK